MALPKHEVMQGAHYAKQYATTYLEGDLSTRIIDYRNAWGGLTDAELPVPVKYLSHEPVALDKWPTVITVVLTTNNLERIGYAGGHNAMHYASDPEYRVSYNMRTYIWCRASNSEATTLQRDRLTTVVRSALLDYPSLKAQAGLLAIDQSKTFRAEIDESSMREEFSDLTKFRVVHGKITDKFSGESSLHAWVEKGDIIFDWQTSSTKPEGIPRDTYYDMYQPEVHDEYTAEETMVNCVRQGQHGPWGER